MASVNKVILIGNLGRDPEIRYTPSGDALATLAVATTDTWKDKATGKIKTQTEWHRISFFGRIAEICGEYLKKGSSVYVEGSLHTRKYTDKDGVEKYATEIKGNTMQMLGGRQTEDLEEPARQPQNAPVPAVPPQSPPRRSRSSGASKSQPSVAPPSVASKPLPNFSDIDDDIPF